MVESSASFCPRDFDLPHGCVPPPLLARADEVIE